MDNPWSWVIMGVHVTLSTFYKVETFHHKTIKNKLVPGFCQELKKESYIWKNLVRNLWGSSKVRSNDSGVSRVGLGRPRRKEGLGTLYTLPRWLAHYWVRTFVSEEKCETTLSSILTARINTLHNAKLVPPANLQADDSTWKPWFSRVKTVCNQITSLCKSGVG